MKKLEEKIKKYGNVLTQVKRSENNAIFALVCGDTERLLGYEVFRIQKNKAFEIQGNIMAASESIPSSEQFGSTAWYYSIFSDNPEGALSRAIAKFEELETPKS